MAKRNKKRLVLLFDYSGENIHMSNEMLKELGIVDKSSDYIVFAHNKALFFTDKSANFLKKKIEKFNQKYSLRLRMMDK